MAEVALLLRGLIVLGLILTTQACETSGYTESTTNRLVSFQGRLGREVFDTQSGIIDCILLESEAGQRVSLVVGNGLDVILDPLRLIDDKGIVIAEEGDLVEVAGPELTVGDSECPEASPFVVLTVLKL